MKKILYLITQSEFGGAQRYVFDLANNLKADFKVAVAMGEQKNNEKLVKILEENKIEYFIISSLKRNLSPFSDISAFFKILKLIKTYQPDIIHLNSSKISVLGSIAAKFTKIKVIYTVHGWVFNEPLSSFIKRFYLWAEKFTARFKTKIICVSEYDKKIALEYKIAPIEKLITIHNGLKPVNFNSKEEARKIINSRVANYELRVTDLIVGSIGNLYRTKGFKYLIEAANIIINTNKKPAVFIIIGDGSERKNLENLIKKYNLANNFILIGRVDEAAKLLKAFDIYVCSSVKEGLPYSILEAMDAELPIITTNAGGIPEMIIDPSEDLKLANGFKVLPTDIENLVKKIEELIVDKTLGDILGKVAKQSINKNFTLEKMVEETKKVYLSL